MRLIHRWVHLEVQREGLIVFSSSPDGLDVRHQKTGGNDVHWNSVSVFLSRHFRSIPTVIDDCWIQRYSSGLALLFLCSYQPVNDPLLRSEEHVPGSLYRKLFRPAQLHPTVSTAQITKYLIAALSRLDLDRWTCQWRSIVVVNGFILCAMQIFEGHRLAAKEAGSTLAFTFFVFTEFLLMTALARQPKGDKSLYFEVSRKATNVRLYHFVLSISFQLAFHEVCHQRCVRVVRIEGESQDP